MAAIGERIGWDGKYVSRYSVLISSISPQVLELAKRNQEARGEKKSPNGEFDFTEDWFLTSGLYELCKRYQLQFMKEFIEEGAGRNWC